MRILYVAFPYSIHTVRWITQISDQKWDMYLFPSIDVNEIHIDMPKNVRICIPFTLRKRNWLGHDLLIKLVRKFNTKIHSGYYEKRLRKYIKRIKPDIIHSLETQSAGYLVNAVMQKYFCNNKFPSWWHTNWGSDLYLYGRLKNHKEKIIDLLSKIDYYSCECQRDAELARNFGYSKEILPIYPNTGGFDIMKLRKIRATLIPTSHRKNIMLKGYQGWSGRSLVAIRALRKIGKLLDGYTVTVYCCQGVDVTIALELLQIETGINVRILKGNTDYDTMLKMHGEARISIGLSISDSISTSVLEAMAMGSFPIQSDTSSANEWLADGIGGFLVPAEEPEMVSHAISEALKSDTLVDAAEKINWETISSRLEYENIKKMTISSYINIKNKGN